jgi:hypothetical protein
MKFSEYLNEEKAKSEKYKAFFAKMLKKFGVSSPNELDDEKKKAFYDAVDKGWKGEDELDESSTRDYVDNIMPRSLKKAGVEAKVTKKTGYTSYKIGDFEIVNDGVGIKVKKGGKEVRYFSKPKLDYKQAVEMVS